MSKYDYNVRKTPQQLLTENSNAIKYEQQLNNERKNSNRHYAGMFFRLLLLIGFCIILVRVVWRVRGNDTGLTFTGFLEWLSNLNSIDITVNVSNFFIVGDWGWFDFFRNFLNIFAQIFGVIVWFGASFLTVLNYLLSFVLFLTIG